MSALAYLLDRIADHLRATLPHPPRAELAARAAALTPDGLWPDLDYSAYGCAGSARFPAFEHLRRALALSAVGGGEPAFAASAALALRGWLRRDPHTDHGWFENLGAPQLLGFLAALHHNALAPAERAALVAILARGWNDAPPPTPRFGPRPVTGQNLLWMAGNRAVGAMLAGDEPLLRHALGLIAAELSPTAGEGIQADASFHQHGPLLYSGGYGANFTIDALRWLRALHDTPFALPAHAADSLRRHLLDGQAWMIRGRAWHWPATGREISRPGHDATALAPACARLGGPRADEAAALVRRIEGMDTPGSAPSGNRLYWRSDAMAHARPGFSFLIRAASSRTRGHESGNGEGEPCALLGDGAVSLLVTGEEYRDLFPLWRWRHVPGVTARHPEPDEPLPVHPWGEGAEGADPFAGGVSDGRVGVFAFRQAARGVHARRAWFCLDEGVIALGTDLHGADDAPLRTTLDQRHADGPVTPLPGGGLHHGGVGWLALQGPAPVHSVEERSGDWGAVNRNHAGREVSARVFTAWIEHGPRPAPFAFACLPGMNPAEAAEWLARAPRLTHNDAHAQALEAADGAWLQAVFWTAGAVRLADGRTLCADAACVVLCDWRSGTVMMGNPTGEARRVVLTLGEAVFEAKFPLGVEAGRPVCGRLARRALSTC